MGRGWSLRGIRGSAWRAGRAPQGEDFFFFDGEASVCGILIPRPGIEPMCPAMEAQTPNYWTTREVLQGEGCKRRALRKEKGLAG